MFKYLLVTLSVVSFALLTVAQTAPAFPGDMECLPRPVYGYRADGKPGREGIDNFKGAKLSGKAQVDVMANGKAETTEVTPDAGGSAACCVLLPEGVAVKQESKVVVTLRQSARALKRDVMVPAMRHWLVYLYNHSHVDIGYMERDPLPRPKIHHNFYDLKAVFVNATEEPHVGNLQVRPCEGH